MHSTFLYSGITMLEIEVQESIWLPAFGIINETTPDPDSWTVILAKDMLFPDELVHSPMLENRVMIITTLGRLQLNWRYRNADTTPGVRRDVDAGAGAYLYRLLSSPSLILNVEYVVVSPVLFALLCRALPDKATIELCQLRDEFVMFVGYESFKIGTLVNIQKFAPVMALEFIPDASSYRIVKVDR